MPTSRGSLVYKGRAPVEHDSIHVARLRAAGAVPVGKTAAPEFGTLNFTRTKAWGVARNPWDPSRTPGGSRGGIGRRGGRRDACPPPRRATAAARRASRRRSPGSSASSPATAASRTPAPRARRRRCTALLTTTVADSARHLDVAAGPDDHDRFSLPAPTVAYEYGDRDARRSRACGPGGRPTSASPAVDPEVRRAGRGRGPGAGRRRRSGARRGAGPAHRPGAHMAGAGAMDLWLDLEPGAWPGVADDLTRYSRSVAGADRGRTPCPSSPRAAVRREQLHARRRPPVRRGRRGAHADDRRARLPAEGPPPDGDRRRAARPSAPRPRRSRCWRTCAGTRRSRCRPGSRRTACRSACRSSPVATPTRSRCDWPAIWEQVRPWPRHAPGLSRDANGAGATPPASHRPVGRRSLVARPGRSGRGGTRCWPRTCR